MTEKTRNLVLTASILATSMVLVFFQAPFLGMGMDISYIAILLGRRYIGLYWTLLICLIYPWVSVGFMGPIGALFIVFQSMAIVMLDIWLNKDDLNNPFGIIMVVLLGTIASALINFLIIVPMYWWLGGQTWGNFFGNYSDMSSSFLKYELSWMVTGLVFNPIKLGVVYGISYGIWIGLEQSVNGGPVAEWGMQAKKESKKENDIETKSEGKNQLNDKEGEKSSQSKTKDKK